MEDIKSRILQFVDEEQVRIVAVIQVLVIMIALRMSFNDAVKKYSKSKKNPTGNDDSCMKLCHFAEMLKIIGVIEKGSAWYVNG